MDTKGWVSAYVEESTQAFVHFSADDDAQRILIGMADAIVVSLRAGGKLMIAGNGGSAADAQHIAGEFVVRLMYDRAPLAAIALTTDSSVLTAAGNDYGFEQIFERQVRALGRRGDVLLGVSTSGRSPNVLNALSAAQELGITTLGFGGGGDGGPMSRLCGRLFLAPSSRTAIVQQVHLAAAHIVCALVERAMFPPPETAA